MNADQNTDLLDSALRDVLHAWTPLGPGAPRTSPNASSAADGDGTSCASPAPPSGWPASPWAL